MRWFYPAEEEEEKVFRCDLEKFRRDEISFGNFRPTLIFHLNLHSKLLRFNLQEKQTSLELHTLARHNCCV